MPISAMPLAHKNVLIACSELKSVSLKAGLEALGATVVMFPVLSIAGVADPGPLDKALESLEDYEWVVFTSSHGARFFLDRMSSCGISKQLLNRRQVCAVGPATAATLAASGITVALLPSDFAAEGILAALAKEYGGLSKLAGLRILLPRAQEARAWLPHALAQAGARVDAVPCYQIELPEITSETIRAVLALAPDLLVFTSPTTVINFVRLLGKETGSALLDKAKAAALGSLTARALNNHGKKPEIVPAHNTIESLLAAIQGYYRTAGGQRARRQPRNSSSRAFGAPDDA